MKTPKGVSRWPNGEPILVLRPHAPQVSLAFAKVALAHQSEDALREAVSNGPATFLGFLVMRKRVAYAVDENGQNAVTIEPGDIFVEEDALEERPS